MLPVEQQIAPNNPFQPHGDGSAQLAAFIQAQPPFLRKNLGECCNQRSDSYKHLIVKSDGEVLTFFGTRSVIRIRQPGIAAGMYLLQEKNVRRTGCYPRMGVTDIESVRPNLHKMWAEGRLSVMTAEQAGELVKFLQYGKDNHNFSSYIFTPTTVYAATASSFALPMQTGLNLRMDRAVLDIAFTAAMRYPQFLVGTDITTESGYSIHEESVLFVGTSWADCVLAACDSASL